MLKHFIAIIGTLLLSAAVSIYAQTLDADALKSFSPSTIREAFEICRYVKLTAQQQIKLAEANSEVISIADRLQKKYDLTDQNWKFIRIAFYKIGLESRVIRKLMADTPKKAEAAIARLREEQLKSIEEKGGIRVNPDMTVVYVREFKADALRKE